MSYKGAWRLIWALLIGWPTVAWHSLGSQNGGEGERGRKVVCFLRKPYLSYRSTPSPARINFVVFSGSVRGWPRSRWSKQLWLTVLWQANKNINHGAGKYFLTLSFYCFWHYTLLIRDRQLRARSARGGTGEERMKNKQTNKEVSPFPITLCAPRKTRVQSPLDQQ